MHHTKVRRRLITAACVAGSLVVSPVLAVMAVGKGISADFEQTTFGISRRWCAARTHHENDGFNRFPAQESACRSCSRTCTAWCRCRCAATAAADGVSEGWERAAKGTVDAPRTKLALKVALSIVAKTFGRVGWQMIEFDWRSWVSEILYPQCALMMVVCRCRLFP